MIGRFSVFVLQTHSNQMDNGECMVAVLKCNVPTPTTGEVKTGKVCYKELRYVQITMTYYQDLDRFIRHTWPEAVVYWQTRNDLGSMS